MNGWRGNLISFLVGVVISGFANALVFHGRLVAVEHAVKNVKQLFEQHADSPRAHHEPFKSPGGDGS